MKDQLAFVQYEYNAILHRWASSSEDTSGISTFDNAGATGQANVVNTAKDWARGLFNSSEYTARPNLTPHDFVYDLYQAFLPYAPDQAGWDWWTSQVGSDWHNKQAVMDSFINLGPYADRAGSMYREVLWLTTDHLGTSRMIAERTGALAGIKRHDYLPFGEELFGGPPSQPGPGGRLTTQGYSANDTVRQKFTGYEHDNETGLDFAQARYYSNTQGRFSGVDPLMASAGVGSPQSWNRYSYVDNNPLNATDPSGMAPQSAGYGYIGKGGEEMAATYNEESVYDGVEFAHDAKFDDIKTTTQLGRELVAFLYSVGQAMATYQQEHPQKPKETAADRIARIAAANVDSEAWRTSHERRAKRNPRIRFKAGEDKCNLFVYEDLLAAGVRAPTSGGKGKWPARAGEWGNPNVKNLGGWVIVTDGSVTPGDVIAQQIPYIDASGHSAIIGPDKMTYGTGINDGVISRTDWGFRPGQGGVIERLQGYGPVVIRRYQGP